MTTERTIWQVGSGGRNRSYAHLFLDHGVALIGPGDPGPWTPKMEDAKFGGSQVRYLADVVSEGDIIVLRTGNSQMVAVGIVEGKYYHLNEFKDVYGWDLQHARRVRWHKHNKDFGAAAFGAIPRSISRVNNSKICSYVQKFANASNVLKKNAKLPKLPADEYPLSPAGFMKLPSSKGVPKKLLPVLKEIHDMWWDGKLEGISEAERVSNLSVPLLRALGWPLELIAVEWRPKNFSMDVAVFDRWPRTPKNLRYIIEMKREQDGRVGEGALDQAQHYMNQLGVKRDIVISDGVHYLMYDGKGSFERPCAYANLMHPTASASNLFVRMAKP